MLQMYPKDWRAISVTCKRHSIRTLLSPFSRSLRSFVCVSAVGLLASVFGGNAVADPVRIRGVQYFGDLPTLVGEVERFFEETGHEVEVGYGLSGKANMEALRRGEIDYALMAVTPFVLDRMADPTPGMNGDPVILANLTHGAPNIKVILRQDGGGSVTTDPKSLEGRRIGLPLGTNAEYLWSLFAAFHEIDIAEIDLVDVGPDQIDDALAANKIEAAVIWAPWLEAIEDGLGGPLAEIEGNLGFLYTSRWVLVTIKGNERAQDHREVVLSSYLRAVDWIQRNPEAAVNRFHEKWRIGDTATGPVSMQDAIFDVTLDWSLHASYQQQLEWANGAGYPNTGGTGAFLSGIETGPLRSLSHSSVLLPKSLEEETK